MTDADLVEHYGNSIIAYDHAMAAGICPVAEHIAACNRWRAELLARLEDLREVADAARAYWHDVSPIVASRLDDALRAMAEHDAANHPAALERCPACRSRADGVCPGCATSRP